jgi:TRAP-type C4-dicarboxylate transport system permease small subunit
MVGKPRFTSVAARVLALLVAPLVFLLMAMTAFDVAGRYLFNRPLYGGYEITELMMGIMVFAMLPVVSTRNEHITIGFNPFRSIAIVERIRRVCVEVLCAFALAIMAWRVAVLGQRAVELGDRTILLQLPVAPFAYAIALFAAGAAFIHLRRAVLLTRTADEPGD